MRPSYRQDTCCRDNQSVAAFPIPGALLQGAAPWIGTGELSLWDIGACDVLRLEPWTTGLENQKGQSSLSLLSGFPFGNMEALVWARKIFPAWTPELESEVAASKSFKVFKDNGMSGPMVELGRCEGQDYHDWVSESALSRDCLVTDNGGSATGSDQAAFQDAC